MIWIMTRNFRIMIDEKKNLIWLPQWWLWVLGWWLTLLSSWGILCLFSITIFFLSRVLGWWLTREKNTYTSLWKIVFLSLLFYFCDHKNDNEDKQLWKVAISEGEGVTLACIARFTFIMLHSYHDFSTRMLVGWFNPFYQSSKNLILYRSPLILFSSYTNLI